MTQSQNTEISIAKMLLCVVLVFGICYFPSAYYFFMDMPDEEVENYDDLFSLSIFSKSVTSAVNFIVYCVMNKKFRETLMNLMQKSSRTFQISERTMVTSMNENRSQKEEIKMNKNQSSHIRESTNI